jgi:quercetin dioxygenase-like cupin family protein
MLGAVMKTQLHSQATLVLPGAGERLSVIGDRQTIKLDGSHTHGAFALIEQNNNPGTSIPEHFHTQEDEIFYVLEGEMEFTVSKEKIIAGPGTTVFLPKGVPHAFKVGSNGARALVMLQPAGTEKMFRELNRLPAGEPDFEAVGKICSKFGIHFV